MAVLCHFFCFLLCDPTGFITTVVVLFLSNHEKIYMSSSSLNSPWCLTRILGHEVFKCHDTRALGAPEQAQQRLLLPCLSATASTKATACGSCRHAMGARLRLYPLAKYDGALVRANEHDGFTFYGVHDAPTSSKWLTMVRLVYLVMLTVQAKVTTQDFL
ncbi:hypothetical protein Tco_0537127 [Tanacetum coccineum]